MSAKVLLADDHVVVRAGLRNALAVMADLEVVGEVGNGRELKEAVARMEPDLLVLDANMPDFDSILAVRQFKAERPGMKILIVSAYDDESYVVGLLNAGADGYHLKDQPLADLQLATQRVLRGDRWISSSLVAKLAHQRTASTPSTTIWLTRLIGKICPTSILYEAGNISEAINLGQQVHPQLALIDVVLENEDGILCARQLRNVSPSTRMVVVSAYPDRGFRKQALSAGAVAFVDKKDLDTASLRQVIEDALR
jgi:DNA-binding NarL/FixJ family response regulator